MTVFAGGVQHISEKVHARDDLHAGYIQPEKKGIITTSLAGFPHPSRAFLVIFHPCATLSQPTFPAWFHAVVVRPCASRLDLGCFASRKIASRWTANLNET